MQVRYQAALRPEDQRVYQTPLTLSFAMRLEKVERCLEICSNFIQN